HPLRKISNLYLIWRNHARLAVPHFVPFLGQIWYKMRNFFRVLYVI
ncbi:hypothetical protein HMPREF1586_01065, partial [Gardnerella vaginalis JCP8522]